MGERFKYQPEEPGSYHLLPIDTLREKGVPESEIERIVYEREKETLFAELDSQLHEELEKAALEKIKPNLVPYNPLRLVESSTISTMADYEAVFHKTAFDYGDYGIDRNDILAAAGHGMVLSPKSSRTIKDDKRATLAADYRVLSNEFAIDRAFSYHLWGLKRGEYKRLIDVSEKYANESNDMVEKVHHLANLRILSDGSKPRQADFLPIAPSVKDKIKKLGEDPLRQLNLLADYLILLSPTQRIKNLKPPEQK